MSDFFDTLVDIVRPTSRACDRCGTDEYLCNVYDGEAVCDNCCEKAYERQQEKLMENGPPDTRREDQQLRDAGRGHLVRP